MGDVVQCVRQVDRRLDRMMEIADQQEIPLDHVVRYMGRCSESAFKAFSENPELLPPQALRW